MSINLEGLYGHRAPAPENLRNAIGEGTNNTREYMGALYLIFHSWGDVRLNLENVAHIPGLNVNLLSLHPI